MYKQSYLIPAAKYLPRLLGHQLPFGVGSVLSLGSAASRLNDRDFLGAGLDTVSGLTSWIPGVGLPVSLAADLINVSRDLSSEAETGGTRSDNVDSNSRSANIKLSNILEDIQNKENPAATSVFYKSLDPLLNSGLKEVKDPQDLERINALKEEIRKGLVSLDYMTGQKKNKLESYYDAHPGEAVSLDLLKKAPAVGGAVAGLGVLENIRRQMKNMHLTEPAKMSRSENSKDPTNPMELLNPGKKPTRSDISSVFGDFDANLQKRLELIDSMQSSGGPDSFSAKYRDLLNKEKTPGLSGADKRLIQEAKAQLVQEAKFSASNAAMQKYVNLHESLRRAGGGLKGYIGEGLGPLSGIADLAQKYHITGANPGFNKVLLEDIVRHNAGHASPVQMKKFIEHTLPSLADSSAQSSGLSRFLRRNKYPLLAGGGIAALGGLYPIVKKMYLDRHPENKINEWKKTILKSRGDFETVKQIEEQEQQQSVQNQESLPEQRQQLQPA